MAITSVTFTPDGTHIISGSIDGSIQIWCPNFSILLRAPTAGTAVKSLTFHPSNGNYMVCRNEDGTLEHWDFGSGGDQHLPGHPSWRLDKGCLYPDQHPESNFVLRGDRWILNGDRQICWVPRQYRA